MPTAAENAHQSKEESEVVKRAAVVDFAEFARADKQRDDEHEGRDESLPEAEPESGNGVLFAGRAFHGVGAGGAGGGNQKEKEREDECREFHGGGLLNGVRATG